MNEAQGLGRKEQVGKTPPWKATWSSKGPRIKAHGSGRKGIERKTFKDEHIMTEN